VHTVLPLRRSCLYTNPIAAGIGLSGYIDRFEAKQGTLHIGVLRIVPSSNLARWGNHALRTFPQKYTILQEVMKSSRTRALPKFL
jgi:hypothetical protein